MTSEMSCGAKHARLESLQKKIDSIAQQVYALQHVSFNNAKKAKLMQAQLKMGEEFELLRQQQQFSSAAGRVASIPTSLEIDSMRKEISSIPPCKNLVEEIAKANKQRDLAKNVKKFELSRKSRYLSS